MDDRATFTVDDLEVVGALALAAWGSALDRDWSVPAGTLEWTCLATAEHVVDCVFSYALNLASRKTDGYPAFDLLRALPRAGPPDMVDGLRAVVGLLAAVIRTSPPEARATIFGGVGGTPVVTGPAPFAPRGGLELTLHGHDVCSGLGVPFEPPADVVARLVASTAGWPGEHAVDPTGDAWVDLLLRSGRPSPR